MVARSPSMVCKLHSKLKIVDCDETGIIAFERLSVEPAWCRTGDNTLNPLPDWFQRCAARRCFMCRRAFHQSHVFRTSVRNYGRADSRIPA